MTTDYILTDDEDKVFDTSDIEDILTYFVDRNGICKICGQDHSFKPTFEDIKTSIDVIPMLTQTKKIFEAA